MRYVAISAAVFGSALFLGGSGHMSLVDARSSSNSIAKSNTQVVLASAPKSSKPAAQIAEQPKPNNVTVAAGDTLTTIATNNDTTYDRLYDANTSLVDPDVIVPGDVIRIPEASETLSHRDLPVKAAPVVTQAPAAVTATPSVQSATYTAPAVPSGSVWDALAACESGGNWSINTGNGFYGGLQFTQASWQAVGGTGIPNQASREEQIARGQILQARGGWGNWPACSAKLGL